MWLSPQRALFGTLHRALAFPIFDSLHSHPCPMSAAEAVRSQLQVALAEKDALSKAKAEAVEAAAKAAQVLGERLCLQLAN